jgi:hypothetical protein
MSVGTPVSVWRNTDGLTEYSSEGANYIVDTADFYLVDTTGFYVIDTGVVADLIPASEWVENDAV